MILLCHLAYAAAPETPQWPAFLGFGHSGLAAEQLPLEWGETEGIAWQTETPGHGQSSPVVWGDRIYLTAVSGPEKNTCHVVCLHLKDGRQLWERSFSSSDPVKNSLYVSRAAPTPVVDAEGVYAFFESGDFSAWGHDGTPRWQRSLSRDYGKFDNEFGLAASPLNHGDTLIQLIDHAGPSYLLAISKQTGQTLWKTERTSRRSWSSPVLVNKQGRDVVVVSSDGSVDGYRPTDGSLLFSFTDVGGNTGTTPYPYGEGRFLVSASPGQRGEAAAEARKSNLAMELEIDGDQIAPRVLWRNAEVSPSFSSPIVHQGSAYWINRAGIVTCLDIATGTQRYAQRTPQAAWATPFAIADRVYIFGKDGTTTVIAAGPEYRLLAENVLWNPETAPKDESLVNQETDPRRRGAAVTFASPIQYGVAVVDNSILIRTGTRLFCIRKPK